MSSFDLENLKLFIQAIVAVMVYKGEVRSKDIRGFVEVDSLGETLRVITRRRVVVSVVVMWTYTLLTATFFFRRS